jgi:hypothetical protein
MIRETDLELNNVFQKSLKEVLPDGFKVDDSHIVSHGSIRITNPGIDFICFVKLGHDGLRILLPHSLEAVNKDYTQSLKSIKLEYADPTFSIEKVAKIIINRGQEDDEKGSED